MSAIAARRARLLAATYASFGEEAVWTPVGGGDPLTITARRREESDEIDYGASRALAVTEFVRIRRSEVASPSEGDLFAFGAAPAVETFKVIAEPQLRTRGTEWYCEVKAVQP